MNDVVIGKPSINLELLDSELRAALLERTSGVSFDGREVIVHLADNATPAQIAQARQIVEAHDASKLSPRQQAEVQRKSRLAQLRQADAALDSEGLVLNQADVRRLARKVLRLEAEIEALRKGE